MAQFYRTNSDESIGGGARVLMVPAIGTYPHVDRLAGIVDLATYAPNTASYGWVDIGSTRSPARVQIAFTKTDWNNEQVGLYRSVITQWTGQASCDALQVKAYQKRNLLAATKPILPGAAGEVRSDFSARINVPYVRLAFLLLDHLGMVHATVIPKAQWDGAAIPVDIARTAPESYPMVWTLFPDESLVSQESGQPILRYDLDQQLSDP